LIGERSEPSSIRRDGVAEDDMKSTLRKRLLLNVLLLCIGLFVGLLMAEALVLSTVGEQAKFPRRVVGAPWGVRYNEPGAEYRHSSRDGTWYFKINKQGMRAEHDYPYEKPPGVQRIVVVGDSFAVGYEVDLSQTFAMVLERELAARNLNVQVLNAGVSGYSTAEAALYLERELIKYQPDVVVSSFYENDFGDNVRTDLFRLNGNTLTAAADSYVPAGGFGNFVNTSVVFNLLSERSNAFVLVKERLTLIVKRTMEMWNQRAVESPNQVQESDNRRDYERRLLAAIVDRMYAFLHARNIALVILSIPEPDIRSELIESFPSDLVDFTRPGLEFVSGKQAISPLEKTHALYNRFSMNHWTPIAHEAAGKALAGSSLWNASQQ
jgi:hypothetical protein